MTGLDPCFPLFVPNLLNSSRPDHLPPFQRELVYDGRRSARRRWTYCDLIVSILDGRICFGLLYDNLNYNVGVPLVLAPVDRGFYLSCFVGRRVLTESKLYRIMKAARAFAEPTHCFPVTNPSIEDYPRTGPSAVARGNQSGYINVCELEIYSAVTHYA